MYIVCWTNPRKLETIGSEWLSRVWMTYLTFDRCELGLRTTASRATTTKQQQRQPLLTTVEMASKDLISQRHMQSIKSESESTAGPVRRSDDQNG